MLNPPDDEPDGQYSKKKPNRDDNRGGDPILRFIAGNMQAGFFSAFGHDGRRNYP
jgi:hypothetical protein